MWCFQSNVLVLSDVSVSVGGVFRVMCCVSDVSVLWCVFRVMCCVSDVSVSVWCFSE